MAPKPPKTPGQPTRKASRHLRVPALPDEATAIRENAAAAGLSVAAFLRNVGQGYRVAGILDHARVDDLAKVNADLGRLGGLLKMWLSDDRRLAEFEPIQIRETIQVTLKRINENQDRIVELMKKIVLS